jgi:hypothetical protein
MHNRSVVAPQSLRFCAIGPVFRLRSLAREFKGAIPLRKLPSRPLGAPQPPGPRTLLKKVLVNKIVGVAYAESV